MSSYKLKILFLVTILVVIFIGHRPLFAQKFTCLAEQNASISVADVHMKIAAGSSGQEGIIQLRRHINIPGGGSSDVWGYFDEVAQREYALVGGLGTIGVSIVDVTDAANPQIVAQVDSVPGFDVKAWGHFIYTVTGSGGVGLGKIIDIADPATPKIVGSFDSSHNIFITDDGFMILESPGIRVLDLNPDPINPKQVWAGGSQGHDASVINNVLYDFHGRAGTFIYDFADPANPTLIGAINDPELQFHHSGWTSTDGNFLFICDELSQHPSPDIFVYDISNPANPQRVGEFGDPDAIVHNLFIIGDYAVTSYYSAGFRVLDISDPANPEMADEYDTAPSIKGGFGGAWGVYPFAPSGIIYVSDVQNGLFLFELKDTVSSVTDGDELQSQSFALLGNYPNPFNPSTLITYQLHERVPVELIIYNALGQKIRNLVDEEKAPGLHQITWNGRNDSGNQVPTGTYFYSLKTDNFSTTKRMLLLK